MSYDIPQLIIADNSPESWVIEAIVKRDHVSPEEAVRRALRQLTVGSQSPADEMWGAFSSPEDSAIIDEAMGHAHERRKLDHPRDFGI